MKISKSDEGHVYLDSEVVSLGTVYPVLNGIPLASIAKIKSSEQGHFVYALPQEFEGEFGIDVTDKGGRLEIQYWVEYKKADGSLKSFGLMFEGLGNLRGFLQNGYFS